MDRPLHEFNNRIIEDGDMSGNITSDSIGMNTVVNYSVQAIWSGTAPVGTLDIQASNDGATFTSILDTPLAVSGNTGDLLVNVEKHAYSKIQIVYTASSGVGTLNVYVNAKRG